MLDRIVAPISKIKNMKKDSELKTKSSKPCFSVRDIFVFCELFLRLEFVNSLFSPVEADRSWGPFTYLKYNELGLTISERDVHLPSFRGITESVKH